MGAVLPTAASPAQAAPPMALTLGDAVFWSGVHIANGAVNNSAACTASTCPTWPLKVVGGAARLRVAIDNPVRSNTFTLEVVDPAGAPVGSAATNNAFAAEVLVPKPAAGSWTIRVVPTSVTDSGFRMRAKLERNIPALPSGKVAQLPNLKTVPPYEFGFIAPANPLNAVYPPDTVNPPLDVAGSHPLSCAADEMAPVSAGGGGATKCLRLTSGPMNVGSGPFEMLFDFATDIAGGKVDPALLQGPMRQVIHYADGTSSERAAGTYSFHKTHAHFHTDQVLTYELFHVDSVETGKLTQTGAGTKSGFCPADQLFGDWHSFTQLPPGTFGEGDTAGGNCYSPQGGVLGLSVGWGDVYRWQRPGQYVEFGNSGDGLYVVRTTADKFDHVIEENENDNAAYAYIQVNGEQVKTLERGQGTDPWDKTKIVFTGVGPAARELGGATTYVPEATSAEPAPAQVADAAIDNAALPRTGAANGTLVGVCAIVTGALLMVRRRVQATPQPVRMRRRRTSPG
ncbi:MAG: hypothetical protein H0U92_06525 [Actinobacteria bacterium]|nr:hypothetical protein [Actinomycetota bacterium]